ncbi:MAG: YkvA family protein, partial [Candidatus Riflebacteria bacterium]|nr:YkvA family protein [Candidatus Riflebacteria bacterium]
MPPEKLKDQIESKLKEYIKKFVRYSAFAHLTSERKQIIAGTFAYLLEDNDMIPDDVPNIGLLDDLMVFVEAARHFLATGAPIAGVCNPEEVLEDIDFVQRHIGLMFGNQHFSIDVIKKLGEKNLHHL